MTDTLPVGASEASILRYEIARELASRCPQTLGEEIALTGSASRGVSDDISDIEINFWAAQIPTIEQQLAWMGEIGATAIFPNVETIPDGSIMTTFTYRGIIVEAGWQTLARQEEILRKLTQADGVNYGLILNGEVVSSAVALRTSGVLAHWRALVSPYPDAVMAKLIEEAVFLWSFRHWVDLRWAYIERGELFVLHRSHVSDLSSALSILWAINRRWGPHWKWISHSLAELDIKPARLDERIATILTAPPYEAVVAKLGLILEILALVPSHIDVSSAVSNISASLQANIVEE